MNYLSTALEQGFKLMKEENPTDGYVWIWTGVNYHPCPVMGDEVLMGAVKYKLEEFDHWKQVKFDEFGMPH